jgi:hypothetical protein
MTNILHIFHHSLLNPTKNPADLYNFYLGAFVYNLTVSNLADLYDFDPSE